MALETYRLRAYENDNYEIEGDRRYLIALQLDTALGLQIAALALERTRLAICERRGLSDRERALLRLAVHDALTGEYVMDWCGA